MHTSVTSAGYRDYGLNYDMILFLALLKKGLVAPNMLNLLQKFLILVPRLSETPD